MNRLTATNLDKITPAMLPPIRRAGRVRVLFLNIMALGWRTYAARLQPYTEADDRIDAVYFSFAPSPMQRLLSHRFHLPGVGSTALMPPSEAISLSVSRWLQGGLDARRFDLVHVTTVHSALGAARLKARVNFKLSATADTTDALYRASFGDAVVTRCMVADSGDASIIRSLDAAVCLCGAVRESLVGHYGLARSATCVVPPCGFTGQFRIPVAGGPAGALPRILFVGNDWVRKGGPELLRWHAVHWSHRSELHVCSEAAKPAQIGRNVVWHGPTPHARVINELMPSCDLFVMPTKEDAYGFVYAEAATAGLPVVGSIMPATPEIVLHGRSGFLFHPADEAGFLGAIDRLLADGGMRRSMGIAAREHARVRFDPDVNYRKLLDHLVATVEGAA